MSVRQKRYRDNHPEKKEMYQARRKAKRRMERAARIEAKSKRRASMAMVAAAEHHDLGDMTSEQLTKRRFLERLRYKVAISNSVSDLHE